MTTLHLAGTTHPGRVRKRNEDAWACHQGLGLAIVADGMGGHPAGHVASRLAVEAVLDFFGGGDSPDGPDEASPPSTPGSDERSERSPGRSMAEAVRSANERILDRGREKPEQQGMGTTLTVLRVDEAEGRYRIGHVGDSRAYLLRKGTLTPLTRDDSPLQERVDAGLLTREEARVHPLGHVLSQALGIESRIDPQVVGGEIRPGDLFLLCSDGLTAVLSEERIEEILAEGGLSTGKEPAAGEAGGDPGALLESLAEDLVEEVLDGGAPDNVTVALIHVAGAG